MSKQSDLASETVSKATPAITSAVLAGGDRALALRQEEELFHAVGADT
ncbi:hypothetical protein [Burkholderia cepacia]|uniref:Uncharacterized protein n=1 Tax=Burkholderia cepacia TaxID=292 RepID=A0A8I1DSI2_BURCE|nr:hypothetical protein [Burkholderia cepacia]ERJ40920.1 hypothetical protein L810_1877 [Burkholderia sp. AU4i]MBH9702146.1 hypothetical protein [Burkholderia cepacia]MBH9718120.1 hypothetical protein [Burkholderia cepacia]MBX3942040.1 hypothetical protein [Burkholderia cepacia]MBX3980886.1 hypothetical protein [Burkholderia cepacia]